MAVGLAKAACVEVLVQVRAVSRQGVDRVRPRKFRPHSFHSLARVLLLAVHDLFVIVVIFVRVAVARGAITGSPLLPTSRSWCSLGIGPQVGLLIMLYQWQGAWL